MDIDTLYTIYENVNLMDRKKIVLTVAALISIAVVGMIAGRVLALQAGQATAQLVPATTSATINQTVNVDLVVSASEPFRIRGAQFSLLVPKTMTVTNVRERITLGNNNAFPALSQHLLATTGQSNQIVPFEVVSFDTLYNEVRITLLTLHPSVSGIQQIIPIGTSAVPLVSFTVTPQSAGSHTISFRSGFPHMIADETVNFLNTSSLSSITLQVGNGQGTCPKKQQGDIDCSGQINSSDLSLLLNSFGSTNQLADLDGSGEVNIHDLSILLKNFGH